MTLKIGRTRLDVLLVQRGLAESRQKAQAMILAGEVSVNGARVQKAGLAVAATAPLEVTSRLQKYVSRGGFKLEGALQDFAVLVEGKVCLDLGASTGGFTDCLLQHGACRVYSVDVNTSQLAWKLQQDPRVVPVKKNARNLRPQDIPEPVDLVVADVAFISVTKVLQPAVAVAKPGAEFLLLVKPQFELRREDIGPRGIVKDTTLHQKAVKTVRQRALEVGLQCSAVKPSRLPGAEGNLEYFLHAKKKGLG